MASDKPIEFDVLYTHQKTKKSKRWQDGCLKVGQQGTRAVLFDDKGCKLDAVYVKSQQVAVGGELESERYLITIEEEKQLKPDRNENNGSESVLYSSSSSSSSVLQQQQQQQQQWSKPDFQNQKKFPLKRKRTGFTVPRQVVKKIATEDVGITSNMTNHINLQATKCPENVPHTGLRAPLFNTPFSKEKESWKYSTDSSSVFIGRRRDMQLEKYSYGGSLENVDDHSVSKDERMQGYQIEEELLGRHCTVTSEDTFFPQSFDADTPKVASLCHIEAEAVTSFNTYRTFPDRENIVSENENNINLIQKSSFEREEEKSCLQDGLIKKDVQGYEIENQVSCQQVTNLSSEETVGKRSASQILALLGKGKGKFKPPVKQSDAHTERLMGKTSTREDLEATFSHSHETVAETHIERPCEQIFSKDVDVMELLGQADLSTAISCTNPCGRLDYDNVNLSRIRQEAVEESSYETTQYSAVQTKCPTNSSRFAESNKSPITVELMEKPEGTSSQSLPMSQVHVPCGRRYTCRGFQNPTSSAAQQSLLSSGRSLCGEFLFPSVDEVQGVVSLKRQIHIPASFPSVASYKQVFTSALKEHVNLILFNLSQRYHAARDKADIQYLDSTSALTSTDNPQVNLLPQCEHGNAAKMVCVKKEGSNKGRFFYACSAPRANQCKFFMWADQFKSNSSTSAKTSSSNKKIALVDPSTAVMFFKRHNINLFYGCEFHRRTGSSSSTMPGAPAWVMKRKQQIVDNKKQLYLNLSRKESSSAYGKDDIWVISKDLTFDPGSTFLAKSLFHGPSSNNEVKIEPLACYSTSNWPSPCTVHAILACNASSELTCLNNLQEHVNLTSVPILQSIMNLDDLPATQSRSSSFKSPAQAQNHLRSLDCSPQEIDHIATDVIERYKLNSDQAAALIRIAMMFQQATNDSPNTEPVTLIHGVFGAGKSFLLAVTVLFLVQLFELSDAKSLNVIPQRLPWKLLIASTTNVAVDRILLGLLGLGFEDFIRVGSLRKIAKPILPYSVHASDRKDSQEIKDLYEMLKTDLTPTEKNHVRRSIDRQRLGQNRDLLGSVRVVGVTCAACTFPCMSKLSFPVILLDECSQMTEPSSLLPIARFQCEKLVLVGDPKQLDPTIQGAEAAHGSGLEQTLFNRLIHQGYKPILLRTQYRCHPHISAIANCLFYDRQLIDGVTAEDRPPLDPSLPTLCFFSVPSGKECCANDGSYYNDEEVSFVIYLIEILMMLGTDPADIGVITLYKAQTVKISMRLQDSKLSSRNGIKAIQISTVDAFQGGEKGVIILSCVRTDYMGFADSNKRTNVALTRSKNHLFIVGNLGMLLANTLWAQVIDLCKDADNGIQTSKAFIKQWTPKLKELQQLEEETRCQKRGRKGKAVVDTSLELKALEEETRCQNKRQYTKNTSNGKDKYNPEILQPGSSHQRKISSPCNESLSFSPLSEAEETIMEDNKVDKSHVSEATIRSSSPSYSPLSEVEDSEEENSFMKEHPPCFDIGGLQDILK